ncbi:MAG: DoxX family protein [Solirubrobacteraceae bacterium]
MKLAALSTERRVALVCGLIFVPAGLVKFALHHWELHAFRRYGIPAPTVLEPIVGAVEMIGGALLIRGALIAPTAFVLAIVMLVAFITGGIIHGDPIPSATLAPALLVALLYLLVTDPELRSSAARWRALH